MSGKLGLDHIDVKGMYLTLNNKIKIGFSTAAANLMIGGGPIGKLMVIPMEDPNKEDVELIAIIAPPDLKVKVPKWEPYKESELFSEALEDGDLKGSGLKPYKGKRFAFAGIQVNITKKADAIIEKFNEQNKGKTFALRAGKQENTFIFGIDDEDIEPSAKILSIDLIKQLYESEQKSKNK